MSNTSAVAKIIYDAFADFSAHADRQTPAAWLQEYLGAQLPSQSAEAIRNISGEIIETLDIMESKKAAMEQAMAAGKSAETWLAADIMAESGGSGEKARLAAAFFNGLTEAEKSLDDSVEAEVIDISEESAAWRDENWNDFKLKDTLKGLAVDAGRTGLKEMASDVLLKASQEGMAALADGISIAKTVTSRSVSGLKTAVSAGLTIAESKGLLPVTSVKVLTAAAFKTVECMTAFANVITGKATMTEALVKVKNTAVATISGMWAQHKNLMLNEIVNVSGTVFGPQGALIAGAVSGLFKETKGESRLATVIKEAGCAVAKFFTKRISMPFFRKSKVFQLLGF
ncbi:MAG: hypothetical protein Q4F00_07830 [bacterium]|nr:hypothetical protein [bacterium]